MQIDRFSPPANVDDFESPELLGAYSDHVSANFDQSIAAVRAVLAKFHAGKPQFYNPVTHGRVEADALKDIPWNGFPKRFTSQAPGQPKAYSECEPDKLASKQGIKYREQDEYLEWFVHRENGKIVRVDFTCEAYDYFVFLARARPAAVVGLYKKYIAPEMTDADLKAVLFSGGPNGEYNPWNELNLKRGAMHLTHPANALGAEIKLAADATVRRNGGGAGEPTNAAALIDCARFGDGDRNSDPKIGFEVNKLARAGYMVTLTDPVGLYMIGFDDAGWKFADGTPATGFMRPVRGVQGKAIRAVYEVPAALRAHGKTVSDIEIGGISIEFGGQIAENITMGIQGAACAAGSVTNKLVGCGPIPSAAAEGNALLSPQKRGI